jgi:uncharacterized protein YciI
MPLYALIGKDGPRAPALRKIHRPAHLAGIEKLHAEGLVRFAGPLLDEFQAPIGSLVVFEAESLDRARAIGAADPYVTEGVFESWQVHETKAVLDPA